MEVEKDKTKQGQTQGRNQRQKRFVGSGIARAICVLLCALQTGCGKADKAMTLPFGEPVAADAGAQPGQESGRASAQDMAGQESPPEAASPSMIYVHVCGAVQNPGVVLLSEESRGQDALLAAGGFAPEAATDAVNLAERLYDGMKLYFPTQEEAKEQESRAQEESAGLININTAGVELLCTLPGIGEARAGAIVAYREEHGFFAGTEDIMRVSGIKESAYGKIKDLITVN